MKYILLLILFSISRFSYCQEKTLKQTPQKWELSISSGPYLDFFWAIVGDPPAYRDKPGKKVNIGKIDRFEMKYFLTQNSAFSLYFQNAQWRELYGDRNDPLGEWKETKRYSKRMHFTVNYYRTITRGKRGSWSIASGFQVQIEKKSFPFYRVDAPNNPTLVTEISARPDWSYFEDWAIPLTIAHHWTINKNLKLSLILNTAYTTGTGIDGLALMGNIAIPFGKEVKPKKSR